MSVKLQKKNAAANIFYRIFFFFKSEILELQEHYQWIMTYISVSFQAPKKEQYTLI